MIERDNTTVKIARGPDPLGRYDDVNKTVAVYRKWLKENNIKYNLVRVPEWNSYPTGINMRNEDALIFKLTFGL